MPHYTSEDLSTQKLCESYNKLLQLFQGSKLLDGSGSLVQFLDITASYVTHGGGGGSSLYTGSTYPITSSWALKALNAGSTIHTGSTYPITSSVSINSLTSSYVVFGSSSIKLTDTDVGVFATSSIVLFSPGIGVGILANNIVALETYNDNSSVSLYSAGSGSQIHLDNNGVSGSILVDTQRANSNIILSNKNVSSSIQLITYAANSNILLQTTAAFDSTIDISSTRVNINRAYITGSMSGFLFGSSSYAIKAIGAQTSSYLNRGAHLYLSQSYIHSATGSTQPAFEPALLWWDDNAKTYAMYTDHSGVSLQIGQEEWTRAYAGEYIPNGSSVFVTSSLNNLPIVKLALADGFFTSTKSNIIGLATETINSGSIGVVTRNGQVHDLDTSAFIPGAMVYASNTISGSWTSFAPIAPAQTVIIGYVLTSNSGSGIIQVNVNNLGDLPYAFVGVTRSPTITGTGGAAFNVSSCSVNLCTTTDGRGHIHSYLIPSKSFTVTSSFLDVQFLTINYNNGAPRYNISTNLSAIDDIQTVPVATFTMGTGGTISYTDWDEPGTLLANKLDKRIIDLYGVQKASGLGLSAVNSHINVGAGSGYVGVKHLTFTTSSTANYHQFVLLSHKASDWSGSFLNGWVNTLYDDGANLRPLGNNKYVANYVFRGIGSLNRSQVILSTQYTNYQDVVNSKLPTVPAELKDISLLVGRVITQQGKTTATLVENVIDSSTFLSTISNHNELNGLQGGDALNLNFYHLTSAEYSTLQSHTSSYAIKALTSSFATKSSTAISSSFSKNTLTASIATSTFSY